MTTTQQVGLQSKRAGVLPSTEDSYCLDLGLLLHFARDSTRSSSGAPGRVRQQHDSNSRPNAPLTPPTSHSYSVDTHRTTPQPYTQARLLPWMPAPSPLEPPPDSEHEDIAATPSATTTTPPDTTSSAPSPPTLSFPSSPAPPTQPVTSKLHGGAPISTSLSTRSVVAPYSIFTPRAKWLLVLLISTAGLFR